MSAQVETFELFGLPRRYAIDRGALEAAYERLTLAHHPDFFAGAPVAERQAAERTASAVNEGYRVLSSDAERADYLLRSLAAGHALDSMALPAGFLQQMFALQEEVEELSAGEAPARVAELRAETNAQREVILAQRGELFAAIEAAGSAGSAPLEALQAIQSNLNCERYLQRLLERLDGERDDD